MHIPSNVTLRGAGADKTILNAIGHGGGDVISMGSGQVPYKPIPDFERRFGRVHEY